jgi:hypothetical protein
MIVNIFVHLTHLKCGKVWTKRFGNGMCIVYSLVICRGTTFQNLPFKDRPREITVDGFAVESWNWKNCRDVQIQQCQITETIPQSCNFYGVQTYLEETTKAWKKSISVVLPRCRAKPVSRKTSDSGHICRAKTSNLSFVS